MTATTAQATALLEPGYYHAGRDYLVTVSDRGFRAVRRSGYVMAVLTAAGPQWRTASRTVREQVRQILADPEAAGAAYVQAAGRCQRCGRPLTDPDSAAAGLGAKCADAAARATATQGSLT